MRFFLDFTYTKADKAQPASYWIILLRLIQLTIKLSKMQKNCKRSLYIITLSFILCFINAKFYGFLINIRHVFEYLNQQLIRLAEEQKLSSVHLLTRDFHVWPDLHGNRSPVADPTIKGMICGLTMSSSVDNLAITYLGFVQALSVSGLILFSKAIPFC